MCKTIMPETARECLVCLLDESTFTVFVNVRDRCITFPYPTSFTCIPTIKDHLKAKIGGDLLGAVEWTCQIFFAWQGSGVSMSGG